MARETIRITPDYIIAKSPTTGLITYSAGTVPTTGTEFPSYLRSTYSSNTIDPNTGYDIYYNQVAPFPYPLLNYGSINAPVATQTVGGSIFSLTAAPAAALNSTVTIINTNIIEAGTYVIVPTIWYIESGSANSLNTATSLSPTESQLYCEIANTSTSFYITKFTTNDNSVLWIGPTSQTSLNSETSYVSGGDRYAIKLNYGMQNPDSINPAVPASYSSTGISSTLVIKLITGSILSVNPAWTKGAVKILYYSRGYLKLRYTK